MKTSHLLPTAICLMVLRVAACEQGIEEAPQIHFVYPTEFCSGVGEVNGYSWHLSVAGNGFAPSDDPVGTALSIERTDGVYVNPTTSYGPINSFTLVAEISSSLAATFGGHRFFDVRVTNPDGQEDVLTEAFSVHRLLRLDRVSPASGAAGSTVTMTIEGIDLYGSIRVWLGVEQNGTNIMTPTSPETGAFEFRVPDIDPGVYPLTIRNAGGCTSSLELAFEVL